MYNLKKFSPGIIIEEKSTLSSCDGGNESGIGNLCVTYLFNYTGKATTRLFTPDIQSQRDDFFTGGQKPSKGKQLVPTLSI